VIKRRELVIALSVYVTGVPLHAQTQQPASPVRVAVLYSSSPETGGFLYDAFVRRMGELGYVEGRNVTYDFRWARGKVERMSELAQELVALHPDVIFATGGGIGALAAKQATKSIPIVTINVSDPVASGLASSLARPGGNVTGISDLSGDTSQKRIEFLLTVVPKLSRIVVLWPPADPFPVFLKSLQNAAATRGVEVVAMEVSSPGELELAFARMSREHVGAVVRSSPSAFRCLFIKGVKFQIWPLDIGCRPFLVVARPSRPAA
jgi:putative tryptophan/tyrosine transport system substrate-binding protein